jgi:hypothetical protein
LAPTPPRHGRGRRRRPRVRRLDDLAARASAAASRATSARWPTARSPPARSSWPAWPRPGWRAACCSAAGGPTWLINTGLIAGGANLLNLFDLRPGRAVKVAALSAGLIAAGGAGGPDRSAGLAAVAAPLGAGLALLPEDLASGPCSATPGPTRSARCSARRRPRLAAPPARAGLLAGIVALTVASEKVSFTKVIERTPTLRRLDMLGRRPAPPTAPATNAGRGRWFPGPDAEGIKRAPGRSSGCRGVGPDGTGGSDPGRQGPFDPTGFSDFSEELWRDRSRDSGKWPSAGRLGGGGRASGARR